MRKLSRHLPPFAAPSARVKSIGMIVLTSFLIGIGYWIWVDTCEATIVIGAFTGLIAVVSIIEHRRITQLRKNRGDTICDFRNSFNVREVDPWIIRATYEAFGEWISRSDSPLPLRATDSMDRDLRIEPEDLWVLLCEVSERAGYDIIGCESNPLFGKIHTVRDFVLFIHHQPKITKTQQ